MHYIQYGTKEIWFSIASRNRKSIGVEVHPDTTVQIKAPLDCSIEAIRKIVLKRSKWIITQQKFFGQFLPETPRREYVAGETHSYLGRKYVLKIIISEEEKVKLKGGYLEVYVTTNTEDKIKHALTEWYYKRASKVFEKTYDQAFQRFHQYNIEKPPLQMKRMKKRWGSFTPSGIIVINPELIKAATACIEYVVVHEICHLIEPNHSKKFYRLLEKLAPDWERWKLKLEKM